eukprot:TRINITY_DN4616_c0_g1_i2.p2 TRINITY_DN4616_c0_g1~~TRINITY_DN4616_c0_g1_i2.p2  ORF type:complete len:113 (+),score=25.12 TRINITY_DN4616_c0_g1_i2:202-540(+)
MVAAKAVDLKKNRQYYEREIKALSSIHSRAKPADDKVIQLLQYGEDQHTGYIFTPYYPCGTLQDYLDSKDDGLELLEALEIFENVTEGVEVIHKANIIHSDLKVCHFFSKPD